VTATGRSPAYDSIIDYHLRPLFIFFDARVATRGLYALPDDFVDYDAIQPACQARIERSVDELHDMLQRISA